MEPFILPEEKLNELAQNVSTNLFERHYFEQDRILGEGLKAFADHEQVNRFLIFQVYQVWEMQISKLHHPYFNLDKPEVAQTLQSLKNEISRCIEINKADFQPMLKRAVYNNLRLLLSPKDTFESFFFAQKETISLGVYERYAQFFHDLDFVVDIILKYYRKNNQTEVDKQGFFDKMERVVGAYNRKSNQDFDAYRREQFRTLTGRSLDEVLREAEAEVQAKEAQKREAEEEASRRAEEESKRQAEEEARQAAEAAKRKAEEEARQQAEEERKRVSFFDTLTAEKTASFDVDLDDLEDDSPQGEDVNQAQEDVQVQAEEPAQEMEPPIQEEQVTPEEAPIAEAEPAVVTEVAPAEETPPPPVEATKEDAPGGESNHQEAPTIETPVASEEPKETPEAEAPVEEAKPTRESTSDFLDRFLSERQQRDQATPETPQADAPTKTEPPQEDTSTPVVPPKSVSTPNEDRPASILDRINERSRTVADRFSSPKTPVGDSLNGQRKIKLDEIPIHKQYQYVQKVFEGNNVRFRIIVDKVNNAQNKDEVEDILNKFVLNNDGLDHNDHVVKEFIELLRNRF